MISNMLPHQTKFNVASVKWLEAFPQRKQSSLLKFSRADELQTHCVA